MVTSVEPAQAELPSRICISLGHNDPEMFRKLAHIEAEHRELLFEFCLEFLSDPWEGPGIIREFRQRWPEAYVIATCRRGEHNFHGSKEEQLSLLQRAVEAGARGIDLEIETARDARQWMSKMRHCIRIVSYHNYQRCPLLKPIIEELESMPADIIKVAVRTGRAAVLWRLVQAARECRRPNVILAMGREGGPTRIIAPVAGRSFTYASPASHEGTAFGQLDARTLREIYRLDQLDATTDFILAFVAEEHAATAAERYNRALAASGVNAVYIPWVVANGK
jgi:3-dehydroquinate dehydratase / shikimate dehydrogenase